MTFKSVFSQFFPEIKVKVKEAGPRLSSLPSQLLQKGSWSRLHFELRCPDKPPWENQTHLPRSPGLFFVCLWWVVDEGVKKDEGGEREEIEQFPEAPLSPPCSLSQGGGSGPHPLRLRPTCQISAARELPWRSAPSLAL